MITQDIIRTLLTSCVFGSIIFFPLVVAPVVFKVLDGDEASRFLRVLFPRYYLFLIMFSGFAAFSSWDHPGQAIGLGFISLSTLFVLQVAVPKINEWRDAEMDGDKAAGEKFKKGHRGAVSLHISRLIGAGSVLIMIAG